MGNVLIIVLLVLVIVFSVKNSIKHFRGEGGCCGGGGSITKADIPVKVLEGEKKGELTVSISGMHCDHCAYSVTKAINRIEGASAEVDWKKKRAVVSYDREVSREAIRSAVAGEGFEVVKIEG